MPRGSCYFLLWKWNTNWETFYSSVKSHVCCIWFEYFTNTRSDDGCHLLDMVKTILQDQDLEKVTLPHVGWSLGQGQVSMPIPRSRPRTNITVTITLFSVFWFTLVLVFSSFIARFNPRDATRSIAWYMQRQRGW